MSCMCGVGQYVVPVKYDSDLLGFLCISGYGDAFDKCLSYAEHANLSTTLSAQKYQLHLKPKIPAEDLVRLPVKPLVSMLTVFFLQNPEDDRKLTIEDIAAACYCSSSTA